ncbi:ATP-binding protein [Desulfonatronospira sp.]|uniref:ATP-binding protein n=1 Tax=Desulfonatronospira sp. TaxID=1962951 RepID=UPI0025B8EC6E|nr:ATP-binding protein [Desulfonatronospira sp.]
MKKLPIGVSTLREIIEDGYTYVDKTRIVHELVESGKYYFLSRPRRFGKSLFIDTLKEAFEGNQDLFRNLWLYDHWDWEKKYPVIHISFAEGILQHREALDQKIFELLDDNQERLQVSCQYKNSVSGCFSSLIRKAKKNYRLGAVVLVDEYDKPILDNISDPEAAAEMREGLKNLYSVIKAQDANIRFAFLTGVSRFSKVSLFSGLNNLIDITLDAQYATICGYTEPEMTEVFAQHLRGKSLDEIRNWYNGYSWLGEAVYNPFSILNYLRTNEFCNFWFESGTPAFLVELFKKKRYFIPELEHTNASESIIGGFDVDFVEPENLLFQTGYLTIEQAFRVAGKTFYKLRYPNMEVKSSLSDYILKRYTPDPTLKDKTQLQIYDALKNNNLDALNLTFHSLFAAIPHDWYRKNKLSQYEGYYASVFYCYFKALGLDVTAEDTANHGRIDMTVRLENRVFIFEFKVLDLDKTPGTALEQIRKRGYADKYRGQNLEIYLIGVEFDRGERNIVRFDWEKR